MCCSVSRQWILVFTVLFVGVAVIGCPRPQPPRTATVPDVVGRTETAAASAISAVGLTVGTVTRAFNATVPEDNVISQNPAGGTSAAVGSAVSLVVSRGPEPQSPQMVEVPDVIGETEASASGAIAAAGLTVGTVTREFHATAPEGQVMSQDPVGGTSVAMDSAVNLVVSRGPEPDPVAVPDVVGMTQAEAVAAIEAAGLTVGTVTREFHATAPEGQVMSQDPAGGTSVAMGSAVNLVVSRGPEPDPVAVPDVIGMAEAEAVAAIEAADLAVGALTQDYSDTVPEGHVISQDPAGGAQVLPGSAVNLLVSRGPEPDPVAVPEVVGMTEAVAVAAIEAADLTVGAVTREFHATVPEGQVISQNPAGGTQVLPGSAVSLLVSMGPEPDPVTVPDVVGETEASASSAISGAGLTVGTITREFHATVPEGQVISQNPAGGAQVLPGSAVSLVVSMGPEPDPVAVPDVIGMTEADAVAAIEAADLTVGAVSEAYSDTVPEGHVISQNPAGGAEVLPGSAVDLVVSMGPEPDPVAVPDVIGMTEADAVVAIEAADLTVGAISEGYSDTVPEGHVISQDPAGGAEVLPGSEVDLVVSKGPQPITPVSNIQELQLIGSGPDTPLDGHYILTQDIDASETATWNGGAGFEPIGTRDLDHPELAFTGTFDGQGYVIANLTIFRPDEDNVGLFGYVDAEGAILNVVLEDCYVAGDANVGGLVGWNEGTVSNSYAGGEVTGDESVGGLVGWSRGAILDSYATGTVTGSDASVGGLLGVNGFGATISRSYATGAVTGNMFVGGLAGWNRGTVSESYASGEVTGLDTVGGLLGGNDLDGIVSDSHCSGEVTGDRVVGGLVGVNRWGATIWNCYSTGAVTGNSEVGGLVGTNNAGAAAIEASFWDTEASGVTGSAGGTGLPTSDMQTESTFTDAGWDFIDIWYMLAGGSYPYLRNLPYP